MRFTKMQGAGNDFVVVDATLAPFSLSPAQIRGLCDRRFGVGCDQVLVVEPAARDDVDFRYRIFNADGAEVEQCGNGARCFVVFVRAKGLTDKREIRVETASGIIVPRLDDDGEVTVDMGEPRFAAEAIPFTGGSGADVEALVVDGRALEISTVSMGNPHAVQVVADVEAAPAATEGAAIERHPRFPARVNAGYMQIVDRANIRLRVYERGTGETLACGTGACAAVVTGIRRGLLDNEVRVWMRGGALTIRWRGEGAPVSMKGPAQIVFEGEWPLRATDATISMDARDVARYLRENPKFFEDYADEIAEIYLPHPHGGHAIPIAERQIFTLREKNAELSAKLGELIRFGNENDATAERLHRSTVALFAAPDLETTLALLHHSLREDFGVPHLAVRLWGRVPEQSYLPELAATSSEVRDFAERLELPYCGAQPIAESREWFDPDPPPASFAFMPLRASVTFGVLALASPDPERFQAGQGTVYLARLAELSSVAIARFLPR